MGGGPSPLASSGTFDVFFSHRRKDLDRAAPLLDALQAAGVRVWRDENELEDFAPITPAIRQALASSKALIAFYSASYPESRPCFEELSTAWIAAEAIPSETPYHRVLVLNPELDYRHLPDVLREQQIAEWPRDPSGFTKLVESIRTHVDGLGGTLQAVAAPPCTRYYPTAISSARRFVGRTRELWNLHGQLTASRMSIITGAIGPAAAQVRGMGGNGKSLLAREYAVRFGAAYPGGVFWLSAYGNDDSKEALDSNQREVLRHTQIRDLTVSCGVVVEGLDAAQVEAVFWSHLERQSQPCLWIVDDLPSGLNPAEIASRWAARWQQASTLITTRSHEYRELGNSQDIDLDVLEEDEALQLLASRCPPKGEAQHEAARGIVRQLGCHPLTVEVAGAYIGRGYSTYSAYLDALRKPDQAAEELGASLREALPTGHARSIAATLSSSIAKLGADGRAFLELASVLAVEPIPGSLVKKAFRHWSQPKPDAVTAMEDASVLSLAKQGEEGDDARTVHTLVSRLMRREAQGDAEVTRKAAVRRLLVRLARLVWRKAKGDAEVARKAAVRCLLEILPREVVDVRRHESVRRELVHARHLVAGDLADVDTVSLAVCVTRYDYERGEYAAARKGEEQVLEARQRLLGPEHPDTLMAMNNLAQTMLAQGCLAEARELQEQVLGAGQRQLGPQHPDTLMAMNNLAGTMQAQGDLAGARELQEQVLEASRRQLGPQHPDTLRAMNNLAWTMQAQGDLTGARELQEQVLESRRRLQGPDHPDTLTAMNNLAGAMQAQGDVAGARELQEQVLETSQRLLGPEHLDTLTAMNNLAATMLAQDDLARARDLQQRVLKARQRLLGPEHPETLIAMNNLAQTLRAQGYLAGARELQEQVLEARRRLLGPEHRDTSIAACSLFLSLVGLEKRAEAKVVLNTYLLPLLSRDPETLSGDQGKILGWLKKMLDDSPEL